MAVMLHFQRWPDVRFALDALLGQIPADRVVIVDNASGDGSAAQLREAYPACRVVEAARNRGYAAGMNLGIRYTTGDVLLLTHDCVLAPGALAELERRLIERPEAGIVGPLLADGRRPDVVFSKGGSIDARMREFHRHASEPLSDHLGTAAIETEWLDGSCLLVRRAVLERQAFDEGYFLYFEDLEYCMRSTREGWRIECVPTALAQQSSGVARAAIALWTRNRLRFLWRNERGQFARQLSLTARESVRLVRSRSGRLMLRGIASLISRERPERLYLLRAD